MTDQEITEALERAAADFNEAMRQAVGAGLLVNPELVDQVSMKFGGYKLLSVSVFRQVST